VNKRLATALALVPLAGLAHAQGNAGDSSAFLSLGAGQSSYALDCAGTSRCDNSGSALRLAAGWRMGSLAIEGVLMRFGTAKATVPVAGFGNVGAEIESEMIGGGVALLAPFAPNLEGQVRLGLASVKTSGSGSVGSVRVDVGSERKAAAYAGLGVAWKFSPKVQLEANWDSTKAEFGGDDGNVSAFTVAIGVRF
jgi:hypothetical protein